MASTNAVGIRICRALERIAERLDAIESHLKIPAPADDAEPSTLAGLPPRQVAEALSKNPKVSR